MLYSHILHRHWNEGTITFKNCDLEPVVVERHSEYRNGDFFCSEGTQQLVYSYHIGGRGLKDIYSDG
jgi:hypothetical protein